MSYKAGRRIVRRGLGLPLIAAAHLGCMGSHQTRSLTSEEKTAFVSRETPSEVEGVPGLSVYGARVRIEAPPGRVWQVLAVGFGDIDRWNGAGVADSDCIHGGEGKLGAKRSCQIADHVPMVGGKYYEEEIVGWDEERGYVSLMQTNATGPTNMVLVENWVQGDGGGGAVVTQLAHVDFSFPASLFEPKKMFRENQWAGLAGLKHYCETGQRVGAENWEEVASLYPEIAEDNAR